MRRLATVIPAETAMSAPAPSSYDGDRGMAARNVLPRVTRDTYSEDRAEQIAYEYSLGQSTLRAMHWASPDTIPPPVVVARWRREKPGFDALMSECERARGLALAEETVEIADDSARLPAQAKNQIAARFRMAEILDRDRMGPTRTLLGDGKRPVMVGTVVTATDDDLMQIAMSGKAGAIPPGVAEIPDLPALPAVDSTEE